MEKEQAPRELVIALASRVPKAFYKNFLSTYEHDLKAAIVLALTNVNGQCTIKLNRATSVDGLSISLSVSEEPFDVTDQGTSKPVG